MNYNKIYFLKNFNSGETLSFPENDITQEQLKQYNESWWNIYESVNTFLWKDRKSENIAEIKSCFIDIDYPEIMEMSEKERASFLKDKYNIIQNNFAKIFRIYQIKPSLINITYKGFHILFNYSTECFLLDTQTHLEINNILNNILDWDKNARDVSRVFKSVWFIDWKGWKKGIIKNLIINEKQQHLITKDVLQNKFNLKFISRDLKIQEKKIKTSEDKKENAFKNIKLYNEQDVFTTIQNTLQFFEGLKSLKEYVENSKNIENILNKLKYEKINDNLYKFFEPNWKDFTSWLVIEKQNWKYEINDYSKKTRRWNYNFLKNWILVEIKKESQAIFFNMALKNIFWFSIWKNNKDLLKGDFKTITDVVKDKTRFDIDTLSLENKELFKSYNNTFLEKINKNCKTSFIALMHLLSEKKYTLDSANKPCYVIYWDEFFDLLWFSKKTAENEKKNYKEILLYLSWLKFPFLTEINWKQGARYKGIFELWIQNNKEVHIGRGSKDFFAIYPLENIDFIFSQNNKFAIFDKKLIQYKTRSIDFKLFILDVDWTFKNTWHKYLEFDLNLVYKKLNLNQEKKENNKILRKHFWKAMEEWVIKFFKIDLKKNILILADFIPKEKDI